MAPGLGLIKPDRSDLTIEDLVTKFPKKKRSISQKTVDMINTAQNDPEFNGVSLIDTMVTYQNIMQSRSSSIEQYMDAIRFCGIIEASSSSNKEITTVEAYKRVFHNREHVRKCLVSGDTSSSEYRELTSAASRYRKSPMVIDILAQADVPLYLMFQGGRYEMAGILMQEARNAALSKDRTAAADKFLTHIKPPENIQIELGVGLNEDAQRSQDKVFKQMQEIALNQQRLMELGHSVEDVQKLNIKQEANVMEAEVLEDE